MRRWFVPCLILIPEFLLMGCEGEEEDPSLTGTYSVGGSISGLGGTAQVKLNGASTLYLYSNGSFTFGQYLEMSDSYVVTVTGASGQVCSVVNGTGSIAGNVSNIKSSARRRATGSAEC